MSQKAVFIQELIEEALCARSVEDIHKTCAKLCRHAQFDYFIYGARFPTSFVKPYLVFISGYPTDWWEHYNASGYLAIDPVVTHCSQRITPLIWEDVDLAVEHDKQVRRFMEDSHEFGLKGGLSTSVHGAPGEAGLLSLATGDSVQASKGRIFESIAETQLLATYIHEAVRRVMLVGATGVADVHLTAREKECLLWTAEGKSSWEIGRILNISENTILYHLKNAARKLDASNRQQAVARAITLGLIAPQFT